MTKAIKNTCKKKNLLHKNIHEIETMKSSIRPTKINCNLIRKKQIIFLHYQSRIKRTRRMENTKSLPRIAPKKDDPQYFIEDKNIALLLIKKKKNNNH